MLCRKLNHARSLGVGGKKQGSKIQIVGEYDMLMRVRSRHDFRINGADVSDPAPVDSLVAGFVKERFPYFWNIRVQDDLRDALRGTSYSFALHVAYANTAYMSSLSRLRYGSNKRSIVSPDASNPVIVPTVIRIPRMQGFPGFICGSIVIRSRSKKFMLSGSHLGHGECLTGVAMP